LVPSNPLRWSRTGETGVLPGTELSELGIATGNPGVFPGYPYPNPSLPVPAARGTGFDGWGCGLPVITVAV